MANTKSALKRWRQSLKRRLRNRSRRTAARNAARAVRQAIAAGDLAAAEAALARAYSLWDRAAKVGAIHTGKADRMKHRLAAALRKAKEQAAQAQPES
ncbi:30S ribosomal protein S20 [bacterium HR29]|jgi:small subunit ribosomal protein S20|nr:30S ribosomal protein S20 [bacterium HR29]